MSLVDYAASSSDDDDDEEVAEERGVAPESKPSPPISILPTTTQMHGLSSSNRLPQPLISEKLPDASLLLNSPPSGSGTDHRFWGVGVASASSLKRDSTALPSSSSSRRTKLPKGNSLLHTNNIPDTSSGMLVPPQLRGRSNVVTEDMGKLFVKRPAASPSQ